MSDRPVKPAAEWVWSDPDVWTHTPQVETPAEGPVWSGLYDAQGRKLYRVPLPFGFRRGAPQ